MKSRINEAFRMPAEGWLSYRIVLMLLKSGDLKKYKSILQKASDMPVPAGRFFDKKARELVYKKIVMPLHKAGKIDPTKIKDLQKYFKKYGEEEIMSKWNKEFPPGDKGRGLWILSGTIMSGMKQEDYVAKPLGIKESQRPTMKSKINEKKKYPDLTDKQYAVLVKDRKKLEKSINKNLVLLKKAKFKKNIGKLPIYTATNANGEPVDITITKKGNIQRHDHFKKWGSDIGQIYGNVVGDVFQINKGKMGKGRRESIEYELRNMIREEIMKSLITEKFASKKITQLFKMMDGRDQKFFATTAKGRGFAWSDVEDKNVGANANPSNDYMNIFILDKDKENPFQRTSEYGRLNKGIIGITIGKKSMYWPKQRYSHKPGMVGNQQKSVDNYKRYSAVADRVISIALSDIPSAKEKQAARAEAQKGATALMQARDVANANHKRYKKALTMKVAATGAEGMEKLMAQAAKVVQQVIDKNTQMLKKGKYQTSWDTYKTVTDRYSRMVDAYVRYKQEFAAAEKEKAAMKGKDVDTSWRRDYVANYMKEIKDYYTDMLQKAKIVNQGEYRDIVREGLNEANPDGTISPDEDKKRAILVKSSVNNMKKFVNDIKKQADKIGGSFRSPGIKAEVKKAIKGIFDSL